MKHYFSIWIFLFVLGTGLLSSQTVKVVTKITERTYHYPKECLLEIDAEKANIIITQSEDNNIKVTLKQIVKNLDEDKAKEEMSGHHFIEDDDRQRLFLRNYLLFESGSTSKESIFKTEYIIEIPPYCHLKISNELGNTSIFDAKKSITADIKYGSLTLNNCVSGLKLKHVLGELSIINGLVDGTSDCTNTTIKLQSVGGILKVLASMGTFNAYLNNNELDLDVIANNCETTIFSKGDQIYNLDLNTNRGTINIPDLTLLGGEIENSEQASKYLLCPLVTKGTIKVDASFCNINYY